MQEEVTEKLVAITGNGSRHVLRLGGLAPDRALSYLRGSGFSGNYPALDRDWLEAQDGRWIKRSAIVELELVSAEAATRSGAASPA